MDDLLIEHLLLAHAEANEIFCFEEENFSVSDLKQLLSYLSFTVITQRWSEEWVEQPESK